MGSSLPSAFLRLRFAVERTCVMSSERVERANQTHAAEEAAPCVSPETDGCSDAVDVAASDSPCAERPRSRRRSAFAVACLALLAVALTAQVLSSIVRARPFASMLTFGNADIQLSITTHNQNGDEVSAEDGQAIPVGTVPLDRRVSATNTGSQPLWVRVRLAFMAEAGDKEWDIAELSDFSVNTDAWVQRGEWFYLLDPLEAGETSPVLIDGLTVDTAAAAQQYGSHSYRLSAHASAVQCKNNANTVLEAEGWPE